MAKGLIALGFLIVIGVGGFYFLLPALLRTSGPGKARALCENAVISQLRSPATAQFPKRGENGYTDPENFFGEIWDWSGVVDSQNGFGATVRSSFTCKAYIKAELTDVTVTAR